MRADAGTAFERSAYHAVLDKKQRYLELLLETVRSRKPRVEKRLNDGQNPFRAWRRHFRMGEKAVANRLGLDFADYCLIEENETKPDEDNILNFCKGFGLHPYDLMSDKAPSTAMIRALVECLKPEHILSDQENAGELAQMVLDECAEEAYGRLYTEFASLYKMRSKTSETAHALEFLEALLRNDGNFIDPDKEIIDYAYEFYDQSDDHINAMANERDYYQAEYSKHSKRYHKIGLLMYRDDWPAVNKNIFEILNAHPIETAMQNFMAECPSPHVPFTVDGLTCATEEQAMHALWEVTFLVYCASKEKNALNVVIKQENRASIYFYEWIENNEDLLNAYDARQEILQLPEMNKAGYDYIVPADPDPVRRLKSNLYGMKRA